MLAFMLIAVQDILRIAFPVWLQAFVLSTSVVFSVRLYFAGERDEFLYAKQLWLLDVCTAMMLGLQYKLVPLVGAALVVPLLYWCVVRLREGAQWTHNGYGISWGLLLFLVALCVLDVCLVVWVYGKLPRGVLEQYLVPLVFADGSGFIDIAPSVGAGDFAVALLVHLLLRAPLYLFPIAFVLGFVAGYTVVDMFPMGFPLLLTIIPAEFAVVMAFQFCVKNLLSR